MNIETAVQFIGMFLILFFVLILIYFSFKYGGKYLKKFNSGNIIKVIERVPLSQNAFLAVVVIDDKSYVVSSGEKGVEILMELDDSVLDKYKNNTFIHTATYGDFINKLKEKMKYEKKK